MKESSALFVIFLELYFIRAVDELGHCYRLEAVSWADRILRRLSEIYDMRKL